MQGELLGLLSVQYPAVFHQHFLNNISSETTEVNVLKVIVVHFCLDLYQVCLNNCDVMNKVAAITKINKIFQLLLQNHHI